jgi:hypothetical protein
MHGWTAPDFVEIKMDAEVGSYQEDYGPLRGPCAGVVPARVEASDAGDASADD